MTALTDQDIVAYLHEIGGSDVLNFTTADEATEAARTLRVRYAEEPVNVEASYTKVFLTLEH